MFFQIAIDGPVGSGKSAIAKELSNILGYTYIDTGAMFRAIALYGVQNLLDFEYEEDFKNSFSKIYIEIKYDGIQKIFLNKKDVTNLIRTPEISLLASKIANFASVRSFLLEIQQNLSKNRNIVMDGRDIATFVLPNANLKIYLDASLEKRIERRMIDLKKMGNEIEYSVLKKQIIKRDYDDKNRKNSPLLIAKDAIVIDTTNMNLSQVLDYILKLIKDRRG